MRKNTSAISLLVVVGALSSVSAVSADERCGPGKIFSRGVIACVQEFCPPTTGRNYSEVCQCYNADWGGTPRVDCRDAAGLLTHCVPEGQTCDGTTSSFDPTTGTTAEIAPSIVPVPVGPPAGAGEIDPTKVVAIHRNTEECDIAELGAVTVRIVHAPEGVAVNDAVVGVTDGAATVSGQDSEASVGDRIDVPPGYSVEVRMPGAIVHLPENARFTLPCKKEAPSVNLSGQGYFNVLDLVRTDLFRVETRNAVAGVKGTKFFVDARTDDKTTVLMEKGVVELRDKSTNETKEIRAGERGEVAAAGITTGALTAEDNIVLAQYAGADGEAVAAGEAVETVDAAIPVAASDDEAIAAPPKKFSKISLAAALLVAILVLGALALVAFRLKRKAPKP